MPGAPIKLGVPLAGRVTDRLGTELKQSEASDLLNTFRTRGRLRPRWGLSAFRSIPATATGPVQNLISFEEPDGTKATLRFDEDAAYNDTGSAWSEIVPGAPPFWTGDSSTPYGWAVIFGTLVVSNGVGADGVKIYTGTGDFSTVAVAGILSSHPAFRYVAGFAGRVIGAYTSGTNGPITVVGSALGSVSDWTSVGGAFGAARSEHPSIITGMKAQDNSLLLWRERAIVVGTETGDMDVPIYWQLLKTEGIGNIATNPNSILSWGGVHAALSHEGFYLLGQDNQPQFIDQDIRRDFFDRLNYAALRQMHGIVLSEYGKFIWFVPEGSDSYPRAAWVYDVITGGWDRWEFSQSISASCRSFVSTGAVIDAYGGQGAIADITGGNALIDTGLISGLLIDSVGTGVSTPAYILGDTNGKTYVFDPTSYNDDGIPYSMRWESPDLTWEGAPDLSMGQGRYSRTVDEFSIVTLDHVYVEYNHSGPNTQVTMSASADGGATWTDLETKNISATSDLYSHMDFWGRFSSNQIRVRLIVYPVTGITEFRNMIAFGKRSGERRN